MNRILPTTRWDHLGMLRPDYLGVAFPPISGFVIAIPIGTGEAINLFFKTEGSLEEITVFHFDTGARVPSFDFRVPRRVNETKDWTERYARAGHRALQAALKRLGRKRVTEIFSEQPVINRWPDEMSNADAAALEAVVL